MKKIYGLVLLLWIVLAGCGKNDSEEQSYPVLRMMTMGSEPAQIDIIYEQLDKLTESELGIDVRISFYQWEDEEDTLQKLVNANSYDIYVYGPSFNSEELANKGAFLDMTGYLEMVPELVEFYRMQGIDLAGQENLYCLPQMMEGSGSGLFYREDLRKEWQLEPISDFSSVENYLYRVKEEYPETSPINDKRFFTFLLNLKSGAQYKDLGYGLGLDLNNGELVCLLDTQEYRDTLQTARKWYREGIISPDILYLQINNTMSTLEMMKQDKAAVEFCNHFAAICNNYVMVLYEINPQWEFGWLDYDLMNKRCYGSGTDITKLFGLAIGKRCQYQEQAILFMEKIHTDARYYNLLCYGAEGIHYRLTPDGGISYEGIPGGNVFRGQVGLEQMTMSLTQQYPGSWNTVYLDVMERSKEMCEENRSSMISEFMIEDEKFAEYQAVMAAYSESKSRQLLENGTIENVEEEADAFRGELTSLGYENFLEAVREEWENYKQ